MLNSSLYAVTIIEFIEHTHKLLSLYKQNMYAHTSAQTYNIYMHIHMC